MGSYTRYFIKATIDDRDVLDWFKEYIRLDDPTPYNDDPVFKAMRWDAFGGDYEGDGQSYYHITNNVIEISGSLKNYEDVIHKMMEFISNYSKEYTCLSYPTESLVYEDIIEIGSREYRLNYTYTITSNASILDAKTVVLNMIGVEDAYYTHDDIEVIINNLPSTKQYIRYIHIPPKV